MKVDLHGLNPGNMHLNNLNAPVLNVLINIHQHENLTFHSKFHF